MFSWYKKGLLKQDPESMGNREKKKDIFNIKMKHFCSMKEARDNTSENICKS